jgi:hypothetical protein
MKRFFLDLLNLPRNRKAHRLGRWLAYQRGVIRYA